MNLNDTGRSTFIRIEHILGHMQTLKLTKKVIILVESKKQLTFTNNPVCSGYKIVSELKYVSQSGYYESPLGYDNVNWFVDEVIKLENKKNFFFKNPRKDIIMTEDEDCKKNNICRFCEKEVNFEKVRSLSFNRY